jgi:CheY-like chemotaxis protein
VATVQQWQPHVILLDVLMAPVDGFTVLHELRGQGLVPGVPVILLSAYLASQDRARITPQIQALGARCWVSKPITDFEALMHLIDHPPLHPEQVEP